MLTLLAFSWLVGSVALAAPASQHYVGCYSTDKGQTRMSWKSNKPGWTFDQCRKKCSSSRFGLFALEGSINKGVAWCECGKIPSLSEVAKASRSSSNCHSGLCGDGTNHKCGGGWTRALYSFVPVTVCKSGTFLHGSHTNGDCRSYPAMKCSDECDIAPIGPGRVKDNSLLGQMTRGVSNIPAAKNGVKIGAQVGDFVVKFIGVMKNLKALKAAAGAFGIVTSVLGAILEFGKPSAKELVEELKRQVNEKIQQIGRCIQQTTNEQWVKLTMEKVREIQDKIEREVEREQRLTQPDKKLFEEMGTAWDKCMSLRQRFKGARGKSAEMNMGLATTVNVYAKTCWALMAGYVKLWEDHGKSAGYVEKNIRVHQAMLFEDMKKIMDELVQFMAGYKASLAAGIRGSFDDNRKEWTSGSWKKECKTPTCVITGRALKCRATWSYSRKCNSGNWGTYQCGFASHCKVGSIGGWSDWKCDKIKKDFFSSKTFNLEVQIKQLQTLVDTSCRRVSDRCGPTISVEDAMLAIQQSMRRRKNLLSAAFLGLAGSAVGLLIYAVIRRKAAHSSGAYEVIV